MLQGKNKNKERQLLQNYKVHVINGSYGHLKLWQKLCPAPLLNEKIVCFKCIKFKALTILIKERQI